MRAAVIGSVVARGDLHGLALRTFLGCVLGYVVWRGGSIFPAMLLHALYNASTLTYGYLKSKSAAPGNAIDEISFVKFNAETFVLLGVGTVLLMIGGWLLSRRFKAHDMEAAAAHAMPAGAFPVVRQ